MHKPASPLDEISGGLEGPPFSSLVLLHDLAAWLCQALQLGNVERGDREVRKRLLAHEACTVYWFPPGQDPQPLPAVAVVPVEGGRSVLSRGPWGGPPRPAAPATATIHPRAQALRQAELQHLAVSRATAAELFGFPLQVEAAPTPAPLPAPVAPPAAAEAADDPNPLGTLRDKVKGLAPIRKRTGSREWPKGVDWRAELLRHYDLCKAPGVTAADVEAELARLWDMKPGSVHKYLAEARAGRDKPKPAAGQRKAG